MIIAMKSKKPNNQINFNQEFRRLGVFIEHVDSNVGLIAEQHSDIKKDIGGIKKTLDSHTEMIGDLAVGLEVVKSDLEVIKKDVKITKDDLEVVKKDVKTTKFDIEIIKTDIELIKNSVKKKIDVDEFAALEKRVLILEKHR
ncbi:MAG: hypothetical protein UT16_C0029G0007 [Candidatus Azambacteria bacterium GW2011_GWA2_39_10]|uniref:Uncharacterized protein n=1 Tax=Candidatus Azambacteria bacterium GW2011_GWA2_39_10 TaxID=1618611 RepID=A0A0G0PNK5_9BACT|nr:MAG: hypothetical protein UT16_C0029G0007 [Candidatus Azambacteria bacterium GW2011_GWA2_39_10]